MKRHHNSGFTKQESALLSEIDKLYSPGDNVMDYFPIEMTSLQIMRAIKEAYSAARRIGEIRLQRVRDRRTEISVWDDGKIIEPIKGKALYEGKSKNGLVIRFWYNFDLDLIEEAYPVRMNNSVKKNEACWAVRTVSGHVSRQTHVSRHNDITR